MPFVRCWVLSPIIPGSESVTGIFTTWPSNRLCQAQTAVYGLTGIFTTWPSSRLCQVHLDLLEYLQLDLTANYVKLRQLCMDSLEYLQLYLAVDCVKLIWTYWTYTYTFFIDLSLTKSAQYLPEVNRCVSHLFSSLKSLYLYVLTWAWQHQYNI